MRLARLLAIASAAALAACCLSACESHVGTAAFIGSARISESTLNTYVTSSAKIYSEPDPNTGATVTTNPKSQVLTSLIRERLFTKLFDTLPGGYPSAGALAAARTAAISQLGETVEQLTANVKSLGYSTAFVDLTVTSEAELTLLLTDLKDPGDGSVLVPRLNKLNMDVRVSPRFGAWDPSNFDVTNGPATLPFLKIASTPAAAATDAAAAGGSG